MRPFSDVDLHAFIDDQVSPERRALIAAYLQSTPAEAARVQGWRRQNEAIRSVFAGTAGEPVPLWLTIGQVASGRERRAGVQVGTTAEGRPLRAVPPRRTVLARRGAGGGAGWKAAVLAIVAFGAGVAVPSFLPDGPPSFERWLPTTPHAEQIRRLAVRTLEAHQTFGMDPDRPVEVLNQPAGALASWFRRRLGAPVRVADLTRLGWTLRGGRLVPGDAGPAALMVYENAVGDRLSVTVSRISNPSPSDTSSTLSGPVLAWLDGPLGFGITTSKEGSWLADNARALYRGIYADAED